MNAERDPRRGQVRLPAFAESAAAEWQAPEAGGPALAGQSGRARRAGIRRVRRMSNWTAAALIVGTGATTVALAHHAVSVGAPAAAASSGSCRGRHHGGNAGGNRAAGLSFGGDDQRVRRDDNHHHPGRERQDRGQSGASCSRLPGQLTC